MVVRDVGVMQGASRGEEGFEEGHDAEPRRREPSVGDRQEGTYSNLPLPDAKPCQRFSFGDLGLHVWAAFTCGTSHSGSTKISSSLTKTSMLPHGHSPQQLQALYRHRLASCPRRTSWLALPRKRGSSSKDPFPNCGNGRRRSCSPRLEHLDRCFASPCH